MSVVGLTTLPNGVRVVSEWSNSTSVALSVRVRVGSRDDPPGLDGLSHLLEHVLTRGTESRDHWELAAVHDRLGSGHSFWTTAEATGISWEVMPDHFEQALGLAADYLLHPSFADVELEREIVLVEMADRDEYPYAHAEFLARQAIFGRHPLARKVIGTRRGVEAASAEDLRAHHARHYVGGAITVAVGGPVHHRRLVSLVRRLFAGAPAGPVPRRRREQALPGPASLRRQAASDRYSFVLGAKGVPLASPLHLPSEIAMDALARLETSLLWEETRKRRGLVYDMQGWVEAFSDAGQLAIGLTVDPERAPAARRVVREALESAQRDGLDERLEIARQARLAKERLASLADRAETLAQRVQAGLVPLSSAEVCRAIESLPKASLTRALRLYAPQRFAAVGLRPSGW